MFQEASLFEHLTVQGNLHYGLQGAAGAQGRAALDAAIALLGIEKLLAQRNARALSGGQQQRVALAQAWALAAQVLLLDEPTASLDPHAKREVEALIHEFAHQSADMTVVFASRNLGQVKRLASRVIYLEQGCVLADLPVQDFFAGALLQAQYPAAYLFVKGEFL